MVNKLVFLLGLLLLAACAAEAPARTQLMLVAGTDIARIDRIVFTVEGMGKKLEPAEAEHSKENPGPHVLGLLYTGGETGPLTLTAAGYAGDERVLSRVARTSFVKGKTLIVPLHLMQRCENVQCPKASDTCTERGCESADLTPDDLSAWNDDPLNLPDPDMFDAGGSRLDAGAMPGDGSVSLRDAALPDAGRDAGTAPSDAGLSVCNGGAVDLTSDPLNCGTCGKVCMVPAPELNAENRCVAGQCKPRCLEGWGTCDGVLTNGCETSLLDIAHCGNCNTRCVGNRSCISGACVK